MDLLKASLTHKLTIHWVWTTLVRDVTLVKAAVFSLEQFPEGDSAVSSQLSPLSADGFGGIWVAPQSTHNIQLLLWTRHCAMSFHIHLAIQT